MSITKIPCLYQGAGKENPAYLGGYDLIRPVNDPSIRTTGLRRVKLQSLMLPQITAPAQTFIFMTG